MEPIHQNNSQREGPEYLSPVSIDQHVISSPGVKGGRPTIAGTRISVAASPIL